MAPTNSLIQNFYGDKKTFSISQKCRGISSGGQLWIYTDNKKIEPDKGNVESLS